MILRHTSFVMLAVVLVTMAGLVVTSSTSAQDEVASGVPMPVIPMGRGENCVEDTDFMRRNHMNLLKHQRDETVLNGIRSEQYSLKECINCHVVIGADAKPLTVSSPGHFCRSCHDYAAVNIDCFQCHASRPESGDLPGHDPVSGVFPDAVVNGT